MSWVECESKLCDECKIAQSGVCNTTQHKYWKVEKMIAEAKKNIAASKKQLQSYERLLSWMKKAKAEKVFK